jgi:hypothetical protein
MIRGAVRSRTRQVFVAAEIVRGGMNAKLQLSPDTVNKNPG